MLPLLFISTFWTKNVVWLLTILIVLIGIGLLVLSSKYLEQVKQSGKAVWHDIVRDLGIAFLVAGIVTIVYGSVLDLKRVTDAVGLMIGENIPQPIWDATRDQFFQRDIIRENAEIRLTVERDPSLPSDQALIKSEISYDVYGLKPEPLSFSVQQELENIDLHNADNSIPRFDSILVGEKEYSGDELKKLSTDGLVTLPPVALQPWPREISDPHNKGIHMVFKRTEIINVPGQHVIVLSELTDRVKLIIDAPDFNIKLKRWFDRRREDFKAVGKSNFDFNGIVFPGQSINVQFNWQAAPPKQTSQKPARAKGTRAHR